MNRFVAKLGRWSCVVGALGCAGVFVACSSSKDESPNNTGGSVSSGGSTGTSGGSASTSGGSASGGAAAGTSSGGGGAGATSLYGAITVSYEAATSASPAHTGLLGKVWNAEQPPAPPVLKLAKEVGECKLLVPLNPFCEEDCVNGVCTADNTCTPYATPQNLGKVSVKGLMPGEFMMEGIPPGYSYQPPAGTTIPYPPCSEGADVTVSGDKFSMKTACIAPLTVPDAMVAVRSGQPVQAKWTAPTTAGSSRIWIKLDIAHHGGKTGEIQCDVPDTGSFDIPEPLVTQLVGLGLAGYPSIIVKRYSSGADAASPQLKVVIESSIERYVDTGIVSCNSGEPCPSGMQCDLDKKVCQ